MHEFRPKDSSRLDFIPHHLQIVSLPCNSHPTYPLINNTMISTILISILAATAGAVFVSGPTGPYAVSMSVQGLTDNSRSDPYAPADSPHPRRVMISTFMPVDETKAPCRRQQAVPYMTPLVAGAYDELGTALGLSNGTFSSFEMNVCIPKASSCRSGRASYPLVLFSPGSGNPRLLYGAMAREVASYGYAVVTIDHPYDASFVEFPDGTVFQAVDIDEEDTTALELLLKVISLRPSQRTLEDTDSISDSCRRYFLRPLSPFRKPRPGHRPFPCTHVWPLPWRHHRRGGHAFRPAHPGWHKLRRPASRPRPERWARQTIPAGGTTKSH